MTSFVKFVSFVTEERQANTERTSQLATNKTKKYLARESVLPRTSSPSDTKETKETKKEEWLPVRPCPPFGFPVTSTVDGHPSYSGWRFLRSSRRIYSAFGHCVTLGVSEALR